MASKIYFSYSKEQTQLINDCLTDCSGNKKWHGETIARIEEAAKSFVSNIYASDNRLPQMETMEGWRKTDQEVLRAVLKMFPRRNKKIYEEVFCVDPRMQMHNLCDHFLNNPVYHEDIEIECLHALLNRQLETLDRPSIPERYAKETKWVIPKNRKRLIEKLMFVYADLTNIEANQCPTNRDSKLIDLLYVTVNPALEFVGRKTIKEQSFENILKDLLGQSRKKIAK